MRDLELLHWMLARGRACAKARARKVATRVNAANNDNLLFCLFSFIHHHSTIIYLQSLAIVLYKIYCHTSAMLNSAAVLKMANRLAGQTLLNKSNNIQCQQVRFGRKTFALKHRYGIAPLYSDHMFNQAIEQDQIEDLSFERVRFCQLWETNSPLKDDVYELYLRYMMRDGRRYLMYELLHETFYHIKLIQFKRKMGEMKRAAAELEKKQKKDKKGDKVLSEGLSSESSKAASSQSAKKTETITTSADNIKDNENDEEGVVVDPMLLFHQAIQNCKPAVVTNKIKRGGATYQVPTPITDKQSTWLAMRWLNDTVKERPKPRVRHYYEDLAQEIVDAAQNRGKVVKKKEDLHKLALANKAYAHYRWG